MELNLDYHRYRRHRRLYLSYLVFHLHLYLSTLSQLRLSLLVDHFRALQLLKLSLFVLHHYHSMLIHLVFLWLFLHYWLSIHLPLVLRLYYLVCLVLPLLHLCTLDLLSRLLVYLLWSLTQYLMELQYLLLNHQDK